MLGRVFHDPLVSVNFEGFDPQIFLNDPQNLQFTFFISYEGGHCDPLNRKLRENPGWVLHCIAALCENAGARNLIGQMTHKIHACHNSADSVPTSPEVCRIIEYIVDIAESIFNITVRKAAVGFRNFCLRFKNLIF